MTNSERDRAQNVLHRQHRAMRDIMINGCRCLVPCFIYISTTRLTTGVLTH